MFGKEASEIIEVKKLEQGKRIEVFLDGSKGSSGSGQYHCINAMEPIDIGGTLGTRLTMKVTVCGIPKLMEWVMRLFMKGMFKKQFAKDLKGLQQYLERNETGSSLAHMTQ